MSALAELDVGGAVRKILQEWPQKLEDAGAEAPKSIELVCQTFQCFPVRADAQRIRLQFALAQGPMRVAILNALDAAGLSVSTGPAPRTFLEEFISDQNIYSMQTILCWKNYSINKQIIQQK